MDPLAAGDRLGPYEILATIGAGGMGTVYKAHDPRLERVVAIKVSQAEFSDRFAREARSIAALNHPNIAQIYDVGPNYLVMEYVEGAPIAAPDSSRKLLDLAVQVADGMAAAHAAGIVHRDLKPDNILVTADGRVKILDFGLAKAIASGKDRGPDATVTIAAALTDPGSTIGTSAYMSPEQARGEENLGIQSDQFSFGLVLYELAAGKRAFVRPSRAETMTAIIREDAEPLPANIPAPLKWVITRLLSKDPVDRYDSSRDLYRELKQVRERLSEVMTSSPVAAQNEPAAIPPRRERSALSWVMLAVGLAAGGLGMFLMPPKPRAAGGDLSKYVFTPLSRDEATESQPAWSPDGKTIAYTANIQGFAQIFTRTLGSSDASQITRVDQSASRPFWSPDGASVYFAVGDELWVVGATGGTAERIMDGVPGATIHPDGKTFAFARDRKFWTRSREGPATEVQFPEDITSRPGGRGLIGFSPDGSKLAVTINSEVWIAPFPSGQAKNTGVRAGGGSWMPDSRRLVTLGMSDLEGKISILDTADGSQRMILSSFDTTLAPAVSPDGKRIAFASGRSEWNLTEIGVPSGKVRTMLVSGGVSWFPAWAPSGTHYLFATNRAGKWAIEDAPATEGFSRRVIEGEGISTLSNPRWSPDGKRFIVNWNAVGKPASVVVSGAAGGAITPLDPSAPGAVGSAFWSPDGAWVMYQRSIPGSLDLQVARIRPGSPGGPEILATYKTTEPRLSRQIVEWSPNGQEILAYGREGLYIESLDFKTERKVGSGIFNVPLGFSKDGRQVLALFPNSTGQGADWRLYSYDVATGASKQLADVDLPVTTSSVRGFSLHPDGTRFATSVARWPFDIWMLEGFE